MTTDFSKPCSGTKAACTDFNSAWEGLMRAGIVDAPAMLAELTKHQDVVHESTSTVEVD